MRRIGLLLPAAADDAAYQSWVGAFLQALGQSGWEIGSNLKIETRWATASADDIRKHAAELVALAPEVLVHGNGPVAALLQATRKVPIVFPVAGDPVAGPVNNKGQGSSSARLWRLLGGLAYGSLPSGSASIHRQCSASAALSTAQASPWRSR